MEKSEQDLAMSRAKIKLMARPDSVFFTSLAFSLHHKFDDEVDTAATNGAVVYYNPKFFMSLTEEERVFLILHETMHCAYLHMYRIQQLGLENNKANIAADHVINLQLIERGFTMPSIGIADKQYKDMSMEQIYRLLPDDISPPPMQDIMEPAGSGAEQDMQDALVRASMQSKLAGDKPGTVPMEIEIFLNKLLSPKLPWHVILRRYMQEVAKKDYSWKKPNRRYFPQHYLPTLYSQSMIDIAVAIDTSGSVSDDDFHQFITEVSQIIKFLAPPKIHMLQFDHSLKKVDTVRNMQDLMNVKFHGRGGTDIGPVMDWAAQHKPKVMLIKTDGYFDFPHIDNPVQHMLWVIHNNETFQAPFGKTIHYQLN